LHQVDLNQEAFIDMVGREVLPQFDSVPKR